MGRRDGAVGSAKLAERLAMLSQTELFTGAQGRFDDGVSDHGQRRAVGDFHRMTAKPAVADRRQVHAFVRDIPMQVEDPSWATLCGIADRLDELRGLPMSIVWGERDWCFDGVFRAAWEHRFPRASVQRIPDAGHYVFEDAPAAVLEAARTLLGSSPLGPSPRHVGARP